MRRKVDWATYQQCQTELKSYRYQRMAKQRAVGFHGRWETIKTNSESNKEVFSLLFSSSLVREKKGKIHKHLLYRQEALMGLTEEERKAC